MQADRFEVGRHRPEPGWLAHLTLQQQIQGGRRILGVERRFAGQQFVKHRAHCPDVGRGRKPRTENLRLLRRHVAGRTRDLVIGQIQRLFQSPRQAKIRDLRLA